MFFDLTNLLATFQTMINELLRDLINTGKIESFIDNMLVETKSKEGHDELVEEILRRIEENYLYVKLEKYKQKVREMNFLGVVIRPERIKMEEEKVKAVLDWLVSKSVKNVKKFLGLSNYYKRFVKEFAKIVRLLHELTRKEQKQEQDIRQEKLFETLKKRRFTIKLILTALDLDNKIRIEMDMLYYGTGEVLSMEYANGKQRLVAYLSKFLNKIEYNYEIHGKEMLTMIRELEA